MVCPKCGYQNSGRSAYCAQCDSALNDSRHNVGNNRDNNGGNRTLPAAIITVCIVVVLVMVALLVSGDLFTKRPSMDYNYLAHPIPEVTEAPAVETQGRNDQYTVPMWPQLPETTEPEHTEHNWEAATCEKPMTCSECGATSGDAAGHQWAEETYNTPKICITCGVTEGAKKTPGSALNLRDIVYDATASSVYSGDSLGRHTPEKLYDGKLNTNWTEDAVGNGAGEYVIFYFDDIYAVNKMRIYIGSHYSKEVYQQNCRPKTVSLSFSDGSTVYVHLEDTYDEQVITLDQYYYTDYVKLTIEEVYTGTLYLDNIIAELNFVVYRP